MIPRTVVTFASDSFNTTTAKPYFINPGCFGDDVLNWLAGELRNRNVATDEKPGQEDFGWFLNFTVEGSRYCFILGFRPGDSSSPGIWIGQIERQCGLIASIFGGRNRNIAPAACALLHQIFSSSPQFQNIRWHEKNRFDAGQEDSGSIQPL